MRRREFLSVTRLAAAAAAGAALLLAGCALDDETAPRPVPLADRALFGAQATGDAAEGAGRIYLVAPAGQDEPIRLRAVQRDVADDPAALLASLVAGPNAAEVEGQLTTRVPPDIVFDARQVGRTLNVELEGGFGELDAAALRLAVAQIVITASQIDGVQSVALLVDGQAQAWPAGDGELLTRPLTVYDYPGLIESSQPAYPSVPAAAAAAAASG